MLPKLSDRLREGWGSFSLRDDSRLAADDLPDRESRADAVREGGDTTTPFCETDRDGDDEDVVVVAKRGATKENSLSLSMKLIDLTRP